MPSGDTSGWHLYFRGVNKQIHSQQHSPNHPALRSYVDSFVVYKYGQKGKAHIQHFLPEGIVEVVLQSARNSWYLAHPTAKHWQERPQNFVGGLHRRSYQVAWEGPGDAFGIRFKPGAFAHFANIKVNALQDTLASLLDTWGKAGNDWANDIATKSTAMKIVLTEAFLLKQLKAYGNSHFDFHAVYQYIQAQQGIIHVEEMAQYFCYSIAHFRHLFSRHFGLSPKAYCRLWRLRHAVKFKPSKLSLTDWAHQLGYFDQAHFNRDIKAFTGLTPKDSLRIAYYG